MTQQTAKCDRDRSMMKHVPDINVLLAAARNDHTHHVPALAWLEALLSRAEEGDASICMPMVVVAGVTRLMTNQKMFSKPSTAQQAVDFIDQLLHINNVVIAEADEGWQPFKDLLLRQKASGNMVPDVWLASHVSSINGVLTTFDKGFKKLLASKHLNLLVLG
jgi:uncharacterized protein